MIKKICTKHGIEYTGDVCPECCNSEQIVEKPKTEKNKKRKRPASPKKRESLNENIDDKLKALMDKWNTKY